MVVLAPLVFLGGCSAGSIGGTATGPSGDAGVGTAAAVCAALDHAVYERVHPGSLEGFYTLDSTVSLAGYTEDRGAAFKVSSSAGAGLMPVYALVDVTRKTYLWTADPADRARFLSSGYADQGIAFYAAQAPGTCAVPVFRLQEEGSGAYRLTTVLADRDTLLAAGWEDFGVQFYVFPGPGSAAPIILPPPEVQPGADAGTVPLEDSGTPPPPPPPADTKFTMVVMPDTQREVNGTAEKAKRFTNRIQYLADNKAALDIRFVMQVGDLVDWDAGDHLMYQRTANDLKILETAKIPYALVPGNHDTAAVGVGGGPCSGCTGAQVHANLRVTTTFNSFHPASHFSALAGQYEDGKVDNAFHLFEAGGLQWMVLSLELWPRTAVVDWAKTAVAAHPRHNVIIITHSYLNGGGGIEGSNGGYGDNSPQYVFDNLVKQYANILFVMSGHVGLADYRVDTGLKGNKVYDIMQCFHDEVTNPSRFLEFDIAKKTVSSRVYGAFTGETKVGTATTFTISNVAFVK